MVPTGSVPLGAGDEDSPGSGREGWAERRREVRSGRDAQSRCAREKNGERVRPGWRGSVLSMKNKIRQRKFRYVNWGGKRPGAGRKPKGERAGVSHAKRARLAGRFPVLVTMKLCAGLPRLRAREHAWIHAALAAVRREDFRVVDHSLQEDHIRALVEARDERVLSRAMNGLATRIARGLNRLWRRAGRVFADRYHALHLTTPRAVRDALVDVPRERPAPHPAAPPRSAPREL